VRRLSYDHTTSVGLLREQLTAFVDAARSFSELDLLGASRCHGWSRLDAVVHVRAGLEEMMGDCAALVDDPPSHDAASYWESFATGGDDDPVPQILWVRRTAAAYNRPSGALRHLRDVAATADLVLRRMPDHAVLFQGKTMTSGDFLATWVAELAIHHLDLGDGAGRPTDGSLHLARRTVEAIADVDLPAAWRDDDAVLVALGRAPLPGEAGHLGDLLPLRL
jgi:Mycothiol maleylpyruvate isomerase N-terminal domain